MYHTFTYNSVASKATSCICYRAQAPFCSPPNRLTVRRGCWNREYLTLIKLAKGDGRVASQKLSSLSPNSGSFSIWGRGRDPL